MLGASLDVGCWCLEFSSPDKVLDKVLDKVMDKVMDKVL
jgi:hypothetical protein